MITYYSASIYRLKSLMCLGQRQKAHSLISKLDLIIELELLRLTLIVPVCEAMHVSVAT